MKLNKWMQVILIGASMMTLAACTHSRRMQQNQAEVAQSNDEASAAEASALEQESGFGEESVSRAETSSAVSESDRAASHASKMIYYFDYDSNVVHPGDKVAIEGQGRYLLSHARAQILIEGHTDPRGSREYNIALGERRAQAVAAVLTRQGVDPEQIRVVSYGAEKLAAPGHSSADYQQDRRAVIAYLKK